MATESLKECRANNLVLTDENIVVIYELAKIADGTYDEALRYYNGKKLGKATIYPLTLGAKIWLQYEAKELCKFDDNLYSLCHIYAYCNSYDPEAFNFKDNQELIKALKKLSRNINFTESELFVVLQEIGEVELKEEPKKESARVAAKPKQGVSQIIGMLMKEFGGTVSYWLWEVPDAAIPALIEGINLQRAGNKDITTISSNDKSVQAYRKLRSYIETLKNEQKINKIDKVNTNV